jgi:hypothetical protein
VCVCVCVCVWVCERERERERERGGAGLQVGSPASPWFRLAAALRHGLHDPLLPDVLNPPPPPLR